MFVALLVRATYHRQIDGAISQEIVVQARKVRASTGEELEGGIDFGSNGILALNHMEGILLSLLELVAQRIQVLDDLCRTVVARGRRDVVKRGIRCQHGRVGRSEELLVRSLQRHSYWWRFLAVTRRPRGRKEFKDAEE